MRRAGPFVVPVDKLSSLYLSGRNIGDEYRYVLDRADALKFPGNMLERPGLLLNPWALRDTETLAEVLEQGKAYGGSQAPAAAFNSVSAGPFCPSSSYVTPAK